MVVLPERTKLRPPVRRPPNVLLSVVVNTAPARPVTVPPMPGNGFELERPRTVWLRAPMSSTAEGPLRATKGRPIAPAVAEIARVLSAPEFRRKVPELMTMLPVVKPVVARSSMVPPLSRTKPPPVAGINEAFTRRVALGMTWKVAGPAAGPTKVPMSKFMVPSLTSRPAALASVRDRRSPEGPYLPKTLAARPEETVTLPLVVRVLTVVGARRSVSAVRRAL